MKSFDDMADDYVDTCAAAALPEVLTESELKLLSVGYLAGLAAGIEWSTDSMNAFLGEGK